MMQFRVSRAIRMRFWCGIEINVHHDFCCDAVSMQGVLLWIYTWRSKGDICMLAQHI